MLPFPAEDVNRALSYVRLKLPATASQLLAVQTRLRKEKYINTRAALNLSVTPPLICITTESDDPRPHTSLQLPPPRSIGECADGTNTTLGDAWEDARNDKGKFLLNDQFIIISNASKKEASRK
ncbi:hypothetical protein AAVH_35317, partial [Aphelenchoides avenae]